MGVTSAEETTPHARTAAARQMAAPWSDVTTSVKVGKQMTRVASVEGMVLDVRGAMVFPTATKLLMRAMYVVETRRRARAAMGCPTAARHFLDVTRPAVQARKQMFAVSVGAITLHV